MLAILLPTFELASTFPGEAVQGCSLQRMSEPWSSLVPDAQRDGKGRSLLNQSSLICSSSSKWLSRTYGECLAVHFLSSPSSSTWTKESCLNSSVIVRLLKVTQSCHHRPSTCHNPALAKYHLCQGLDNLDLLSISTSDHLTLVYLLACRV